MCNAGNCSKMSFAKTFFMLWLSHILLFFTVITMVYRSTVSSLLAWLWMSSTHSTVFGQEATVTAIINISFDPTTQKIIFEQSGNVLVPDVPNDSGQPLIPSLIWSNSDGFLGLFNGFSASDQYIFDNSHADTSCLLFEFDMDLDTPVPSLNIYLEQDPLYAELYVPGGYVSGSSLDATTTSVGNFLSLEEVGLVEGATCFYEYDVDNNVNTGSSANGYDAAIQWNVLVTPTAAPSMKPSQTPSMSSAPSFHPSSNPSTSLQPSHAPSDAPTCFTAKSAKTKSDGSTTNKKKPRRRKTESPRRSCRQTKSSK